MQIDWRHLIWRWRGALIAAPSMAGLVILLRLMGLLQPWEWSAYDWMLRSRPSESIRDRIVIVGINEADIQAFGQASLPDAVYAEALDILIAQQPRAIGLDIYRDVPVEPGHTELVQIFESTPNLIGIQKVVGDAEQDVVAPPPALQAKGQVGANDIILDADGRVRRGFISVTGAAGNEVFSLGAYLALLYLNAEGIGFDIVDEQSWWLGDSLFTPLEANDGSYVRTDAGGYQIVLNYHHPDHSTRSSDTIFDTVSLTAVLNQQIPPDWGRDRIILIGNLSESSKDAFFTPYSGGVLGSPRPMMGVEIHAHLTSQILSAALDGRSLIQVWPDSVENLWIVIWSSVGALLAWRFRLPTQHRLRVAERIGTLAIAILSLITIGYGALVAGWWIPVVPPLLGLVGSAIAVMGYVAYTASDIRRTFGRYLSDDVVATLLEQPGGLQLGGERRTITILTSDLRGFTTVSAQLSPEMVIRVLNFYLGRMADVITAYGGTIDEFMGDGILVLFGAPTQHEDDVERAVACAIAMQQAIPQVNQQITDWQLSPLAMGIAVHLGEVVVGNIGSEKRAKYGVVGSAVNLTYRIESYTTGGQVLVSDAVLAAVPDLLQIDKSFEIQPKGVAEPIQIHSVRGVAGTHQLYLPTTEETWQDLTEPVAVQYAVLVGKQVQPHQFTGQILRLSQQGALIQGNPTIRRSALDPSGMAIAMRPYLNLKISFVSTHPLLQNLEIYAKVRDKKAKAGQFFVEFTSPSTALAQYVTLRSQK
ncbi:MAG: CHASE2 domain-containing protein [Thainema sp.]